jgi:hypothetical protein
MKMSHEEYVEKATRENRAKAVSIVQAMLDGSIDYIVGARQLSGMKYDEGFTEDDADLAVFSLIDSETDSLPIGHSREYWSKEALERLQPEIDRSVKWAKGMSLKHCKSIVRRFSA